MFNDYLTNIKYRDNICLSNKTILFDRENERGVIKMRKKGVVAKERAKDFMEIYLNLNEINKVQAESYALGLSTSQALDQLKLLDRSNKQKQT